MLLLEAGYEVVGVFIRTWQPDFITCTWRDERRDAMRVCAHLNIPFLECDAEEVYKKNVADYMIAEYKIGRTPNPDVMCNREVKFGVFWNFAKARGADYIATGHYAQNILLGDQYTLQKGINPAKDQSYFLWTLNQKDLAHVLFPVGHLQKIKVRKLAEKYQLPTAEKKDSQGVCFIGPLDMKKFLAHYIPEKKGDVLNEQGKIIGYHQGALFFTFGERHGFTITLKESNELPYYVIAKDVDKNTITVSHEQQTKSNSGTGSVYSLKSVNWIIGLKQNKDYSAQIRYHGEFLSCALEQKEKKWVVHFKNQILVSPGQSVVIYDKNICLGGGVVV